MYNVEELKLITGVDIFIEEYQVKIHQPTIKEIALVGEEQFFSSLNMFLLDIEKLKKEVINMIPSELESEKITIQNFSEFEMVLFFLNNDDDFKLKCKTVLNLLFNEYNIEFLEYGILIKEKNTEEAFEIDELFFNILKEVASKIFVFSKFFNSVGKETSESARKIQEKLAKAKEKINKENKSVNKFSFFSNIISILGISGQNFLDLNNLTIYQLLNQFERYGLYMQYDQSIKAALAGAQDVEIVDWFKQL